MILLVCVREEARLISAVAAIAHPDASAESEVYLSMPEPIPCSSSHTTPVAACLSSAADATLQPMPYSLHRSLVLASQSNLAMHSQQVTFLR